MTTRRTGSPARGPSPPSCRSGTTSPSRRSPGVSRPYRPRPPPPHSLLLHRPPPLFLLPLGRPEEGGGAGDVAGDVVVALVALLLATPVPVGAVGAARRHRLRLPLPPLLLEVHPGHPSATHGQGASRCGRSRVREGGLILSSSRRPCSLALLHSSRPPGPRPLSPASSRPGLGGGTRPLWRSPSAPWDWRRRPAPSGSPTRVPRSTP